RREILSIRNVGISRNLNNGDSKRFPFVAHHLRIHLMRVGGDMKNFVCRTGIGLSFLLMSVCQGTPSFAASSTEGVRDTFLLDEHPELLTPSGSLQQRAATPSADAAGYKVRIVYL